MDGFEPLSINHRNTAKSPRTGLYLSRSVSSDGKRQVRMRIGEDVMRQMRWLIGDRITLGISPAARMVCIERVSDKSAIGWTLSSMSGKNKDGIGKMVGARVHMAISPEYIDMLFPHGDDNWTPTTITFKDEGVVFDLPDSNSPAKG